MKRKRLASIAKLTRLAKREQQMQRLRLKAIAAIAARDALQREMDPAFYALLDPGIRRQVRVLIEAGVETWESCDGSPGHCYPEPTVCFRGDPAAALDALRAAAFHRLPVAELNHVWRIGADGMPCETPYWQMIFRRPPGKKR